MIGSNSIAVIFGSVAIATIAGTAGYMVATRPAMQASAPQAPAVEAAPSYTTTPPPTRVAQSKPISQPISPPPTQTYAQEESMDNNTDMVMTTTPPPPLPVYEVPPPPEPDMVWAPGYWRWDQSQYVWVGGGWVRPPQPQVYWTPGYWLLLHGAYGWHEGHWGRHVGYYGGIPYGGGYDGHGFHGGAWHGEHYQVNRTVTNRPNIPHETHVESFHGTPGAISPRPEDRRLESARPQSPTNEQRHIEEERRLPNTQGQIQHGDDAKRHEEFRDHHPEAPTNTSPQANSFQPTSATRSPMLIVPAERKEPVQDQPVRVISGAPGDTHQAPATSQIIERRESTTMQRPMEEQGHSQLIQAREPHVEHTAPAHEAPHHEDHAPAAPASAPKAESPAESHGGGDAHGGDHSGMIISH